MPISAAILQSLDINDPSIKELVLTRQELQDADIIELCDKLKNNTHLKKLNLAQNKIGNAGACALAKIKTIKSLNLGLNRLGQEGIDALATNPYFEHLEFNNPFNPNGVKLDEFLNHCSLKSCSIKHFPNALSSNAANQAVLTAKQKKFLHENFHLFYQLATIDKKFFGQVLFYSFNIIFNLPNHFMTATEETIMEHHIFQRHESLKAISLFTQSKQNLLSKLPKEVVTDIYSFLVPQRLLELFVKEQSQKNSKPLQTERQKVAVTSKLFLTLYGLIFVYQAFNTMLQPKT